jgi:folate-binding protein YgfZ
MTTLNLTQTLSVIHVQGEKTADFLQSQLTNDVRQASEDTLQWQAYCNRQGLVQSIFALWGKQNDFYLLLAKDLAAVTLSLLQKYGVFAKIRCEVLSPEIILQLEAQSEKNLQWKIKEFNAQQLMLVWPSHFATMPAIGSDDLLLRFQLMQHQFPWLCQKTIDLFRPHDLHLPELSIVNFQKGCYPGQEIIARTHYRGKPKQSFFVYQEGGVQDIQPGQLFQEGDQQVGQVVDAIIGENTTYISAVLLLSYAEAKLPKN